MTRIDNVADDFDPKKVTNEKFKKQIDETVKNEKEALL